MSDLFGGLTPTFAPRHIEVPAQDSNDWFTPLPKWRLIDAAYDFNLDVCAHALAPVTQAIRAKPYGDVFVPDEGRDALRESWAGARCWFQPPYSAAELTTLFERLTTLLILSDRHQAPRGVVGLLPAKKTEQAWWQAHVEPWRDDRVPFMGSNGLQWKCTTRFLSGRWTFGHPGDPHGLDADQAMFGLVLVSYQRAEFSDPLRSLDLEGV